LVRSIPSDVPKEGRHEMLGQKHPMDVWVWGLTEPDHLIVEDVPLIPRETKCTVLFENTNRHSDPVLCLQRRNKSVVYTSLMATASTRGCPEVSKANSYPSNWGCTSGRMRRVFSRISMSCLFGVLGIRRGPYSARSCLL